MGNWEDKIFDEIIEDKLIGLVRNTKQQSPEFKFDYLKMNNITNEGNLDLNDLIKVNAEREEVKKYELKKGDFLFNTRNSVELVGKTAVYNNELSKPLIFNNNIMRSRFKKTYDPYFINYQFQSSDFQKELEKIKSGTTSVAAIYYKSLKNIKLKFPPLPEQKSIVAKLDGLFEKIDQAIFLLEENIQHTQALMGSVLDEEFRKLESSSEIFPISKIANVKGGKRLPKGKKLSEEKTEYPYIRVSDFSDNGTIDLNGLKFISSDVHKQISRYTINSDDLYISIAGTIGKTGIIPKELNGANLTENAAKLVYKDKATIDNLFVYFYTLSDKFKSYIEDSTKQVAQPKLALIRLKEVNIALPSLEKQREVVQKFKNAQFQINKLIESQTQKLNNLKALKSSLLDQAFKGEL